ncbi:MAG: ATP cone domain-containing protein [Candidatus Paceibacterota bacterium]
MAEKGKHVDLTNPKNTKAFIKEVQKRDGSKVPFELSRIANAIYKAMLAAEEGSDVEASMVANKVFADLVRISKKYKNFVPTVEGIQDTVEKELIVGDYVSSAKKYILYREKRAQLRQQGVKVPEKVKKLTEESRKYLRNPLAEFIYYRTYSRWMEEEGRRETWIETVDRYMDFMKENLGDKFKKEEYKELREAILNQEVMPSMRLMWSAGKAARRTNVCAYNCSFIAPRKLRDLGEIVYLSMCGAGVGFSVESQHVEALPQIKKQTGEELPKHVIADSKEGWADALVLGLETWFSGKDIKFDYSQVRPRGSKLKTMGGKSSGPEPLMDLLKFAREKVLARQGRRLSTLDVHDIICKIGEVVVAGGARRSALISLSDLDDPAMRDAKKGEFYVTEPQRSMANNSVVYNEKPSEAEFLDEWLALMKSQSGERGIFNRGSLEKQLPERRWKLFADKIDFSGANPCCEIVLRSKQFCNLSEVVARSGDTKKDLLRKARLAAMLGTYQSSLTNFGYLSKEWEENCKEERLLGVSITGQWDCEEARKSEVLQSVKKEAIKTNQEYAKRLGINPSTAVTCVKPSGTVSQLVDASSGMHPRYAKYYIRRVRISDTDSLFQMLKDQGVPFHPEVGQSIENANTYVLDFPVKAPEGAVTSGDLDSRKQLEYWKKLKENYTEHNPSVTITVSSDEWISTAHWLYNNWDIIGGLSFLPKTDHVYRLAPYEEIDEERYKELSKRFTDIDFSKIVTYEGDDNTEGAKEYACVAGGCSI